MEQLMRWILFNIGAHFVLLVGTLSKIEATTNIAQNLLTCILLRCSTLMFSMTV